VSATVVVRGTGAAAARPDRAALVFDLGHVAPTAAAALQQVADRTSRLEVALRTRGVAEADWTTTGVTVHPVYEWRKDTQVLLGQRAANRIRVTTRDAGMVGLLLTDAVEVADARVGGPDWIIEPGNPAHEAACRLAALDARRRAAAYALGLGLALGEVITVDEVGRDLGRPYRAMAMMAMAAPSEADESAPIEVNAGDLEVTAMVVVTFSLVSPHD
jgi:uncharacterized protein YggE